MKKPKKEKQLLTVTWRDSNIYNDQGTSEDTEVAIIQTSGFLISADNNCLKIARDLIKEDQWRGLIVIPRENVIKME